MTEEGRRPTGNPAADEELSARYREIATERAPATLNETILRTAAAHSGKRYARAATWLRPLAWAATVGLSLAVVLELTDVEQQDGRREATEALFESEEVADWKTERSPRGAASSAGPPASEPAADADGEAPEFDAAAKRSQPASEPAGAPAASAFRTDPAALLEEASDRARSGQADDKATSAATPELRQSSDAFPACDDADRETPESWLACIERLRKAGFTEPADRELGKLREQFPQFELP